LDIKIPIMQPRINREYKNLAELDINSFKNEKAVYRQFSLDELREIVFKDIDDNISHKTIFKNTIPDFRNVIAFITSRILREARLVSGFDVLYPKVEALIKYRLWEKEVVLSDPQTMRNLSEAQTVCLVYDTFSQAISRLTIVERSDLSQKGYASVAKARPIVARHQSQSFCAYRSIGYARHTNPNCGTFRRMSPSNGNRRGCTRFRV